MRPPRGAEPIIAARERRERPSQPVVVSFVGRLAEISNPQVHPTGEHDWTFAADLEVILYARVGSPHFSSTLRGLAPHARDIAIWDVDLRAGMSVWGVWRCPSGDLRPLVRWQERRAARFVRWVRLKWCPQDNRIFDGREEIGRDDFAGEPSDAKAGAFTDFHRRFELAGRALT